MLDDALDDYNNNSSTTTTNNNTTTTTTSSVSGLSEALQQVEGLDQESIQAIMRMTNQALGGTTGSNSSNSGQNYFY